MLGAHNLLNCTWFKLSRGVERLLLVCTCTQFKLMYVSIVCVNVVREAYLSRGVEQLRFMFVNASYIFECHMTMLYHTFRCMYF